MPYFSKLMKVILEPCLMKTRGTSPRMGQHCRMNLLSYPAPLWAITVLLQFASLKSQSQNFTSQP